LSYRKAYSLRGTSDLLSCLRSGRFVGIDFCLSSGEGEFYLPLFVVFRDVLLKQRVSLLETLTSEINHEVTHACAVYSNWSPGRKSSRSLRTFRLRDKQQHISVNFILLTPCIVDNQTHNIQSNKMHSIVFRYSILQCLVNQSNKMHSIVFRYSILQYLVNQSNKMHSIVFRYCILQDLVNQSNKIHSIVFRYSILQDLINQSNKMHSIVFRYSILQDLVNQSKKMHSIVFRYSILQDLVNQSNRFRSMRNRNMSSNIICYWTKIMDVKYM
jgi:hypothetical protein